MTGLFFRRAAGRRVGPVILLLATVVLQLAALPPARAAGGTLSVDDVTVTEPAGGARAVVFTVTLARGGADRVTVHYETADGTATAGQDYLATSGALDFGPAGTTRTVRVPVLGDGLDEAAESFVLHLSGASTGQAAVDGTATITDTDPEPRLSIGDARVVEGDSGTVNVTFPVSLSDPSGRAVTINYATSNGSGANGSAGGAVAPDDYTTSAGTLTFAPGDRVKPVVVPVAGDVTDEGDETFTVTLTGPANAAVGDAAATGTIVDDDGAPTLSVEDVTAGEGSGRLTFKVAIDHPSAGDVTFRVQTVDGTGPNGAKAPGDYSALAGTPARIAAGGTSVAVDVPLTNDNVHEAAETFTLVVSAVADATVARPAGTGTITDDDTGPDLSAADVSAPESTLVGGRLDFTITLSAAAATPVTVDYATADGTAVSQASPPDQPDYTATSGTLTFKPGEISKPVTVLLNPDGRAEGDETVFLNLSNPGMGVALARPSATGTINNDDGPPDELAVSDVTFAEGGTGTAGHLFTVTRTRRSPAFVPPTVTVRYTTADGSAKAGRDYTPRTGLLIFSGSATTQTVSVSVGGDLADEDDETLTVTLSSPTNAVLVKGTGTATIVDDDDAPVVSVTPVTVPEGNGGAGSGLVDVTLSAPSSRPITVAYTVGGGTASAADYSADTVDGTITFEPGETIRSLGFSVVGDTLDEPDETFDVTLSNAVNAAIGAAEGTVTIADDDVPPAVSIGDETITETDAAGGPLTFTVALDDQSGQAVSVTVATADGPSPAGATAPGDYTDVPGQVVTIPAGVTAATVAVTVIDDTAQDGAPSETFVVNLSAPVNATVADGAATGTIIDNEGPATLSITGDTVTEGSGAPNTTARFLVTLSKESVQPITVDYATADGTPPGDAQAPSDYVAKTGTVTFTPGTTSATVAVDVMGDTTDEVDEAFTVALANAGGGILIDPDRGRARAAILDDDGPNITAADIKTAEGNSGAGSAVFTVTLSASSPQPVSVDFATANGTAGGGSDYMPISGTLTFFPGETSQTVAVAVAGDTLTEGDEDFFLTLSGAVGGAVTAAAGRAEVTDDDLSELDIADAAIAEGDNGAATLTFTVTLAAPSTTAVSVTYASGDRTAAAGQDYDATSGDLTFNPGDTTGTIVVPVTGDTGDQVIETFAVTLSAPGPDARIGKGVATGTIIDDDAPPEIFSPDVSVQEPTRTDTSAVFPVRLAGPRSFAVTVHYETRPHTASAPADFTPESGDLTFAPGDEVKPVPVPIKGDSHFEAAETIGLRLSDAGRGALADPEAVATIVDDDKPGYVLAGTDGAISTFGGAGFFGSAGALRLNQPIVSAAPHPSGRGYWVVGVDGGVFPFGEAKFFGSTGALKLRKPIVGMAPTPSGQGYWLVATDGGIFAFGDARFHGSTGALRLKKPIVGMAPTPSGQGYWLVATDGGIFSFGDARFFGSTGAVVLNRPIVGMASTPSGAGYWLLATDGGIFSFGDARFFGSTGAVVLNRPIVGMASTPSGAGYWLVATDGGVYSFGDAPFLGSTGALRATKPVVALMTL